MSQVRKGYKVSGEKLFHAVPNIFIFNACETLEKNMSQV